MSQAMKSPQTWLMKTEPNTYSIDNLKKDKRTLWECVRNYQARNFMMKEMKVGDLVLIYHSNAEPPGLVGLAKISKLAQADPTQFDRKSDSFDPKATKEKPIWFCVEVEFVEKFKELIPLEALRAEKALAEMQLLKRGQRLSIQPVRTSEFSVILDWAHRKTK